MFILILFNALFFDRKNILSISNVWILLIIFVILSTYTNGFDFTGIILLSFTSFLVRSAHLFALKSKKIELESIFKNELINKHNAKILLICIGSLSYYIYTFYYKNFFNAQYDEINVYGHNQSLYLDIFPNLLIVTFLVVKLDNKILNNLLWLILIILFALISRRTFIILTFFAFILTNNIIKIKFKNLLIISLVLFTLIIGSRFLRIGVVNSSFVRIDNTEILANAFESNLGEFDECSRILASSDLFEFRNYVIDSWFLWPTYFIPRFVWPGKPDLISLGKNYVKYELNSDLGYGLPIYIFGSLLYSGGFISLFIGSLIFGLISGFHSSIRNKTVLEKLVNYNLFVFITVFLFRLGDLTISITQLLPILIASLLILFASIKIRFNA